MIIWEKTPSECHAEPKGGEYYGIFPQNTIYILLPHPPASLRDRGWGVGKRFSFLIFLFSWIGCRRFLFVVFQRCRLYRLVCNPGVTECSEKPVHRRVMQACVLLLLTFSLARIYTALGNIICTLPKVSGSYFKFSTS